MELKEVLLKRRSIRKYTDDVITDEEISELLHSAMSGPSAMNKQPWEFVVVRNNEILNQIRKNIQYADINGNVAIIVCGNMLKTLPLDLKNYWLEDCAAATENILLTATSLNLGSLWCGIYPQKNKMKKLKKLLNLPLHIEPFSLIYIGHAAEEKEARDQYNESCIRYIK